MIGRVYMARGIAFKFRAGGKRDAQPVPQGMNWDAWVGPGPVRAAYNTLAVYRWRFLKAYGNGEIGDQGVHQLDMIRWGLGLETHPNRAQSTARRTSAPRRRRHARPADLRLPLRGRDEGRDLIVEFETRDGYTNPEAGMGTSIPSSTTATSCGVIFLGTEGYMIIPDYSSYYTFLGPSASRAPARSVAGAPMMDLDQFQNWVRRHPQPGTTSS